MGSSGSASPRPEASSAWALTQGGSLGAGREGSRGGGVGNSSGGGSVVLTGRGRNGRPGAGGECWWPGPWLGRARPRRVCLLGRGPQLGRGLGRLLGLRAWCTSVWSPQQWRSGRPQPMAALAVTAAALRVRED